MYNQFVTNPRQAATLGLVNRSLHKSDFGWQVVAVGASISPAAARIDVRAGSARVYPIYKVTRIISWVTRAKT